MKTSIETITPQQAKKYLQSNTDNRTIRQGWVDRLAGMMKRDEWSLTHQGIAFSTEGRLIDGQHRLRAIVQAEKPVQMMVAREIDEAAYRHIDGGAPRTVADRIQFCEDMPINKQIAAIVRVRAGIVTFGALAPTIDQIEDEFLKHDEAYLAVGEAWCHKVKGVTRAEVGAALVSYSAAHKKQANTFASQLLSGEQLFRGHPAYMLREGLIQGRIGQGRPAVETYFKCIAAMRAHQEDRVINSVLPSTDDFQGNPYTTLCYEMARRSEKGAITTKMKKLRAS